MKGRILKILISLSLIICIGLFGVVMPGCNDNELPELPPENQEPTDNDYVLPDNYEPPNSEVVLEATNSSRSGQKDFIGIFNSYEDLKDAYSRNVSGSLNSFSENKIREYMNKYSKYMSLVACAFYRHSDPGQCRIGAIEVENGKLTMYVTPPNNIVAATRENTVLLIAGVNKSLLEDVTELTYVRGNKKSN